MRTRDAAPTKESDIDVTMADDGFMTTEQVEAFTGIPHVTLDKMSHEVPPRFPPAMAISGKRKGYPRRAVVEWARATLRRAAQLPAPRRA
jgi:predicted DNA-binding transcriptional regulator AlpA